MRIIAGKYRSRILLAPKGLTVRPSADRLRETLFNVLTPGNPAALVGTTWIDLYAGTGAVGIEALSRGAADVHFVDISNRAITQLSENLEALGIETGFSVIKKDANQALKILESQNVRADFVFLDPPYELHRSYTDTLEKLSVSTVLKTTTTVIAEHAKLFDPGEAFPLLSRFRKLAQGDAVLSFYRKLETPK